MHQQCQSSTAAAGELAVPAAALQHALRTPLNVLAGYAALLAGGGLGALDADARLAVAEMHAAARALERTVELLDLPDPPPTPSWPWEDLAPVLARTIGARCHAAPADADFALAGVAWVGWPPLFAALAAAVAPRGAGPIRCRAEGCSLAFASDDGRCGSGDATLPAFIARARAAAGGLAFEERGDGGLVLHAEGLMSGRGVLIVE